MIAVVVAAVVVVVVVVVAAVAVRWWTWRPVVRRRVMVQVDTGLTFEGVVMSRRGPLLVLGDVTVHDPHATPPRAKADGQSVLERRRVVWIQAVT